MTFKDSHPVSEASDSVKFSNKPEMVALFAELTGDRSSLHTDDAFAKRALYRQKVVYGMLPLVFVPILDICRYQRFITAIKHGARVVVNYLSIEEIAKQVVDENIDAGGLASQIDVANQFWLKASSQSPFTTGQQVMVTGGRPPFL